MFSDLLFETPVLISYCSALLICIITVEVLLGVNWTGLLVRLINGVKLTLIALFDETLEEEQQEVALRKAALAMLSVSFKTLFLLLAILGIFYLDEPLKDLSLSYILEDHGLAIDPESKMVSWSTMLLIKSIISMVYWYARVKIFRTNTDLDQNSAEESDQTYSEISKALHDLALDSNKIAGMSFQYEKKHYLNQNKAQSSNDYSMLKPVWVCGLARAGTTILTDVLYETEAFTSLTYRQMPFPLAPNMWKKLSRWGVGGNEQKVERAHGDGLLVNIDSPEALEEVFWRVHEPHIYQDTDSLSAHEAKASSLSALEDYISCIMLATEQTAIPSKRYLSKNNNHLLRLPSLLSHFQCAKILIPIREPLEHAESLRRQHLKWVQRHQDDSFSLSYMNWLAHHEFGLGHKPFNFQAIQETALEVSTEEFGDPNQLNYWLNRWTDAYSYLETILAQSEYDQQLYVVDYHALSTNPKQTLTRVFNYLELDINQQQRDQLAKRFKMAPKRADRSSVDRDLLVRAEKLYQHLQS